MNKFQKLAELNKDIELLEAYGKFKSALILHEKFIRVAQEVYPSNSRTREDRAPILNPGFDTSMRIRDYILEYAKDIKRLGNKASVPKTINNLKEQDFIEKVKQGQINPDLFDENTVQDYAFILSNQANATSNQSAQVMDENFLSTEIKPTSYATEDRGYTYEKYFNGKLKKLQNAQNKDLVISEIRSDGFLKEEDKLQIINAISSNQTETSSQNSKRQPQIGNMELATTPVPDIGPNPDPRNDVPVSPQTTSNRGDGLTVNKGNIIYPEDTANQNAKELSAEEMKKRIQYYEDKINEYHNLKNNPKYKEKMLLYLTTYMDNNYDQGKLDSNSYSRLMNALGEKSGIS